MVAGSVLGFACQIRDPRVDVGPPLMFFEVVFYQVRNWILTDGFKDIIWLKKERDRIWLQQVIMYVPDKKKV